MILSYNTTTTALGSTTLSYSALTDWIPTLHRFPSRENNTSVKYKR